MIREIVTYPLDLKSLERELSCFVQYFTEKGFETCEVLFGFAWGTDYYPESRWWYEYYFLNEIEDKIREVEGTGIGEFGGDDLYLIVGDYEFLFCHESDIHIYFAEPTIDTEHFYSRWKSMGYKPAEYIREDEKSPSKQVRFN